MNNTQSNALHDALMLNPMWGAVWAMSLCAMALVASEFLPVSLLTPIASDLSISEGSAGQSISISGLFALIASLSLTSMIGDIDRRRILLFFTLMLVVSGAIVAFAPTAWVLMVGRALLGICIGGFWSMSFATIMRLVPDDAVPKALAILNGGNALSMMVAAPLGSFLGGIIGWRGAFFCIVPVAIIAFIWQWVSLPALPARRKASDRVNFMSVLKLLVRRDVAIGMTATALLFMGQFALFTYLRPFLETVTNVSVEQLSMILLAMGIFGMIGTFLIGKFVNKHLYTIAVTIPFLMALIACALILFGHSMIAVFVLISLWGLFATSAPVAWGTWLSKSLPNDAEAAGGLMVAIIQLAITLGAAVGGLIFDSFGYQLTFTMSASILMAASVMAFVAWHLQRGALLRNDAKCTV